MNPFAILPSFAVLALSVLVTPQSLAEVTFGPILAAPGQSVRMVSRTTTEGGTVKLEKDGRVSNGTIVFSRDRDLSWTFRNPAADGSLQGMVTVAKIETFSSTTIDGKTEESKDTSPLNGKMFAMSKPVRGDWKFELDGSVPMRRIEKEISELTLYLKRQWYPQRKVGLGESWEFDPAWIRALVERDFKHAKLIGTMNLRQLRHTAGGNAAVIDVSVRGTGGDFQADGTDTSTQIELSGQVFVNLKTMLDELLELKGTVVTRSGKPGDMKTVTLPLRLEVTKKLVNN